MKDWSKIGVKWEMRDNVLKQLLLLRRFLLTLPGGVTRQVTQIQTEEWPDLTAPEEPR